MKDKDGGGAFYIGDDEHSCASYGLFVDAWQPCPKGYMPKGKKSDMMVSSPAGRRQCWIHSLAAEMVMCNESLGRFNRKGN